MEQRTILIVDDDPDFRSLLCAILKQGGYATVTASDGAEGVETAKRITPDMILLDVQMPGLDGYEATAEIRKEASLDRTPIVLVTVQSKVAEIVRGLKLGADDHVTKPFHPDEVLVRVNSLIERGRGV